MKLEALEVDGILCNGSHMYMHIVASLKHQTPEVRARSNLGRTTTNCTHLSGDLTLNQHSSPDVSL